MRPVWAEVNLCSVVSNLKEVRRSIPNTTKVMAIVKANAYGHGAGPVAKKMVENGVEYLGVALLSEAVQLREYGISSPILILGYTPEDDYPILIRNNITQTIFTHRQAELLSQAADNLKKNVRIHIKVDTGMGRIGFQPDQQAIQEIKKIAALPALEIEGLFTHLAKSDARDKSYTSMQLQKYFWVCNELKKSGINVALKHAANSAAIIDIPEADFDLVRPGIMLYGLYPSDEVDISRIHLRQAMALKANICHVKNVKAGVNIGYGCTYTTTRAAKIATLPLGYADGYTRLLSNKGVALVRGQRVPIVGRICMDQCMLDVSEVDDAEMGDEAVLFGKQGKDFLSIDEVAELIGTINYEIVCMISARVPRIYSNS